MDGLELAKGIVAGYVIDLIRGRAATFIVGGLVVGVVAAVGVVFFDGFGAVGLGIVACIGFAVALVSVILRWLAIRAVCMVAQPAPDPEERVRAAFAEADLPTGPLSLARLFVRVARGGAGGELDRLRGVLTRLAADVEQT